MSTPVESPTPFCDKCGDFAADDQISEFQRDAYKTLIRLDSPNHITVLKAPAKEDPLWSVVTVAGSPVSLNFVEFETRKRYRVSGVVRHNFKRIKM